MLQLNPETQSWVKVVIKREGIIFVDPYSPLYTNEVCIAGTGVAYVKADKRFRILIANFGDNEVTLLPHQVVQLASDHAETLVESHLWHGEAFGLIPDNTDTKFGKLHTSAHELTTINTHLTDDRKQHMGGEEKPVTAEDIAFNVLTDNEDDVRSMLKKHERACSGQLSDINAT